MNLSSTSKILLRNVLILAAAELVLGSIALYIYFPRYLSGYIIGLVIGTMGALVKTVYLELSAVKFLEMEQKDAKRSYRIGYFIRLAVTIGIMVIAAVNHPVINLYATTLGLVNVQFAAYGYKFEMNRGKKSERQKVSDE